MKSNETQGQEIKTEQKRKIKNSKKEILVGKNLEEINKIKEDFNSKKRKMINKLMK